MKIVKTVNPYTSLKLLRAILSNRDSSWYECVNVTSKVAQTVAGWS